MKFELNKINFLLSKDDKKKLLILFFLILVSSLLDGLSIGVIYPLFKLIISINFINEINSYLSKNNINILFNENSIFQILLIIIFFIFLLRFVITVIISWWKSKYLNDLNKKLSLKVYKKIIFSEINFFKKNNSSDIIRLFNYDVPKTVSGINCIIKILAETLSLIFIFIILSITSIKITISLLTIYLIIFLIIHFIINAKIKSWSKNLQFNISMIIQSIQELLGSIKIILIEKKQNFFENNFQKKINSYTSMSKRLMFIQDLPRAFLEISSISIFCVVMLYLGSNYDYKSLIPLIAMIGAAAIRIIPSVGKITNSRQLLEASIPSINSVFEYNKSNYNLDENNFSKTEKNLLINYINFNKLSFKYENQSNYIFKNFSLKINKNDFLFIKGRSGLGKTTLIDIIAGLLIPEEGEITIDDKKYKLEDRPIQKNIAYIPQNVFLLNDTLKNNIIFDTKNFDQNRFYKVIKQAELENIINKLPDKEESILGENGALISIGEKQRIGIARALYTAKEILICDEITSSLDEKTKFSIMQCLKKINKEKTIIFVSHDSNLTEFTNKFLDLNNFNGINN